jgi:hypothetical protein
MLSSRILVLLAGSPGKHFDEWMNNGVPHPTFLWLGGGFDFQVEAENVVGFVIPPRHST